jgi:hypothetical protein
LVTATNRPDPSFAVAAIHLLQSNSILEAAQLCASGVEHYPDYIGGYVLLASAYESLGQSSDAQLIREALYARFPGLPPLRSYVQVQPVLVAEDTLIVEEPHASEHEHLPEEVPTAQAVSILDEEHATEPELELYEEPEAEPEPELFEEPEVEPEPELYEEPEAEPEPELCEEPEVEPEPELCEEPVIEPLAEFYEEPATETAPAFYEEPVMNLEAERFDEPAPVASHPNVLRLIEMAPITTDTRIIRSSSVRLIPGLEFTSLRFEGTRSRGRREITSLLDPPAFRTFHQMRRTARPSDAQEPRKKPVTLEELAARLNDARLPRNTGSSEQEISREDFSAMQSPILITETIARIYMQQGSYELAIEAFKALQKQKPEKANEFEKLIKECERKRA